MTTTVLAAEWHPTKNGELKFGDVSLRSVVKVWWLCAEGHEWEQSVRYRTVDGGGCPECARFGRSVAGAQPALALEWHPTRNSDAAERVRVSSAVRVWWQCAEGHEWLQGVSSRAGSRRGCPECAREAAAAAVPDVLDEDEARARLGAEWHPERNYVPFEHVSLRSAEKAWWKCAAGHEWWQSVRYRAFAKRACRECVPFMESVAGVAPVIAAEWHPTKNAVSAELTRATSHDTVWWVCAAGHEWAQKVRYRVEKNAGCRECRGMA